jgi:hypothetical protein
MNTRRNKILFIVAAFVILSVVIIVALIPQLLKNKSVGVGTPAYNLAHQAPDHAGPYMVDIKGTTALNQILLSGQYSAAMAELNSYILSEVSPKTVSAQITDTTGNITGPVTFTVQTSQPSEQFNVSLDLSQYATIGFSVPSSGFQKTLNVYGSSTN